MVDRAEREALNFFFASIPLSELPPTEKIVMVRSTDSVAQVVRTLASHNILAAPVINAEAPADAGWVDKYSGIVDMVGVVFFLMDVMQREKTKSLERLLENKVLETTKVIEVATTGRWGPFVPLQTTDNMLDAMLLMGKYGLHRLPIVQSPGGDMVNLLTQSAVVGMIAKHMDQFQSIGQLTLEQLGLASPATCYSVRTDSTLREAVALIQEKSISAVPVLGMNGVVVGNVSARDLRNLVTDPTMFSLLHEPVRHFLAQASTLDHEAMNPAITCRATDTLEHVIQQLAATRIHRIYVCDTNGRLTRVLSLSDILNVFVQEPSSDYFGKYDLMVRQ